MTFITILLGGTITITTTLFARAVRIGQLHSGLSNQGLDTTQESHPIMASHEFLVN